MKKCAARRYARVSIAEQPKWRDPVFWVGVAGCVAQGICGILVALDRISADVASAVMCMMSGLFLWTTSNNPNIPDVAEDLQPGDGEDASGGQEG